MTLTKIGASLSGGADVIHITQASHGFTVGQVLKVKSNDPGKYATAMANTAANAEVVGIVVQVISASIFVMALSGRITADGAVPDQQAGTVLFLSPSSAGALTVTEPTTTGEISKPVCVITTPDSEMIMVNYRGKDADAVHNWDANGSELILDVDGDTSLHADTDDRIDVKISGADDFRFTANTLSILSGSTLAIDSGATLANSGTLTGFTNNSTFFTVTQSSHGLSVGHVVKANGNSTFAKAQANTAANAEVVGVVTVVSGNDITITTSGEITVAGAVPDVAAGTVVFLHEGGSGNEGTLTATEPSTDDEISKPIAIVTYQNSKMVLLPFRGEILGTGAQSVADDSITLAKMAGGTDGNLITYDTSGNPAYVATGSATHVLTSNGADTVPTFQAAAGGPTEANQANMKAEATGTLYAPPDMIKNSPGVAKAWSDISDPGALNTTNDYNVATVDDNNTGNRQINWTVAFTNNVYVNVCTLHAPSLNQNHVHFNNMNAADVDLGVTNSSGNATDDRTSQVHFGEQ